MSQTCDHFTRVLGEMKTVSNPCFCYCYPTPGEGTGGNVCLPSKPWVLGPRVWGSDVGLCPGSASCTLCDCGRVPRSVSSPATGPRPAQMEVVRPNKAGHANVQYLLSWRTPGSLRHACLSGCPPAPSHPTPPGQNPSLPAHLPPPSTPVLTSSSSPFSGHLPDPALPEFQLQSAPRGEVS